MFFLDTFIASAILAAIVLRFSGRFITGKWALLVAIIIIVLACLPYPYGASHWVLSYFSSFSISTLLLALAAIASHYTTCAKIDKSQLRPWVYSILLAAIIFYPLSLGLTYIDPYGLAYSSSKPLALALFGVAIVACFKRYYWLCWTLIIAQLCYLAHLLQSANLWDYLLDPALVIYVVFWIIKDIKFLRNQTLVTDKP